MPADRTALEQAILDRIYRDFFDPENDRQFDPRKYVIQTCIYYTDPSGKERRASERSVAKATSSLASRGLLEVMRTPEDWDEDGRGRFDTYRVRPAMSDEAREIRSAAVAAIERMRLLDRYSEQPDHDAINDGLRRTMRIVFEKIPACEERISKSINEGNVAAASRYTSTLSELLRSIEDVYPQYEVWDAEMHTQITRQVSAVPPGSLVPNAITGHSADGEWVEVISPNISM